MIKLEDYLYGGETIFKILNYYSNDLEESSLLNQNPIDLVHSNLMKQIYELLEHNEFLYSQSQRMREFYRYMVKKFPYLAFTFKGRIKSIIRAEEKFNRYIVDYTYEYFKRTGSFPPVYELKQKLGCFRDLIAYRIVIQLPRCRVEDKQERMKEQMRLLYEIANDLPDFLQEHDFTPVESNSGERRCSDNIADKWREYYRDYVVSPTPTGYQSLHMTLFDNQARCYIEVQLRTKEMDDSAEIGRSNHQGYEKLQSLHANYREEIPEGKCKYFDEAYERICSLEELDLSKVDVNMFAAVNNSLINDGCGLFRGRQILPMEHLSRFQNEVMD